MVRSLARLLLIFWAVLAPLWICAWAGETASSAPPAAATSDGDDGELRSSESSPPVPVGEGASAVDDDDEVPHFPEALASGEFVVLPAPVGRVRFAPRAGAAPPSVHFDIEPPPPRA